MELLNRIEINEKVLKGKAVIKGTRLLGLLGNGADVTEILEEYDSLAREDILACLLFASQSLDNQLFIPLPKDAA